MAAQEQAVESRRGVRDYVGPGLAILTGCLALVVLATHVYLVAKGKTDATSTCF